MTLLIKGLLIGILIALPVGPSGAIAVRRAITRGPRAGFLSGVGASVADLVYLAILEFGPALSFSFLKPDLIRGAGALVMVYIGMRLFVFDPLSMRTDRGEGDRRSAFFSSFLLSIANPVILISLAVLLSSFELGGVNRGSASSLVLLGAVFCGSVLMWLLLTAWLARVKLIGVTSKVTGVFLIFVGAGVLLATLIKRG